MKKKLTDRTLQALQNNPAQPGKRYDVWDSELENFGVRVNDQGKCVFIVLKRLAGGRHPTRFTVGKYPGMSLAEAHQKAKKIVSDLADGKTPQEQRAAKAREAAQRRQDTFGVVAEEFIKRHVSKLRTRADVERSIRRDLISRWGDRPMADIGRADLIELLNEAVDRGSPYAAHHYFAYVHQIWAWAIERGIYGLETSPADRMKPARVIGKKEPRQRILNDREIRLIWSATSETAGLGYPIAPLVRLLLITGQRLREVAEARWSEIDLEKALWTIPLDRMKGKVVHEIPLSPMAVDLLSKLPRFTGGNHIFTTTGGVRPISGFSKFKRRLDAASRSFRASLMLGGGSMICVGRCARIYRPCRQCPTWSANWLSVTLGRDFTRYTTSTPTGRRNATL